MLADITDESVHSVHVGLLHLSLDHAIDSLSDPEPAMHIGGMSCVAKAMMRGVEGSQVLLWQALVTHIARELHTIAPDVISITLLSHRVLCS